MGDGERHERAHGHPEHGEHGEDAGGGSDIAGTDGNDTMSASAHGPARAGDTGNDRAAVALEVDASVYNGHATTRRRRHEVMLNLPDVTVIPNLVRRP